MYSGLMYEDNDNRKYDDGYMRFVGYANSTSICNVRNGVAIVGDSVVTSSSPSINSCIADCYSSLFSKENLDRMSCKITQLLQGVGYIIVPHDKIAHVLYQVYSNSIPSVGDIYSKYIVGNNNKNYAIEIIDRSINIIVTAIRNEFEVNECNNNLSIWDATLLGDNNERGLRAHSTIKLRDRGPDRFQFNMNY